VQKLLPMNPQYQELLRGTNQRLASLAARALVDVAQARLASVQTVRMTQQAEEQARAEEARKAALVNGSSPSPSRVQQPKQPGWDAVEAELRRSGQWVDDE
jgi:hypothetical protein